MASHSPPSSPLPTTPGTPAPSPPSRVSMSISTDPKARASPSSERDIKRDIHRASPRVASSIKAITPPVSCASSPTVAISPVSVLASSLHGLQLTTATGSQIATGSKPSEVPVSGPSRLPSSPPPSPPVSDAVVVAVRSRAEPCPPMRRTKRVRRKPIPRALLPLVKPPTPAESPKELPAVQEDKRQQQPRRRLPRRLAHIPDWAARHAQYEAKGCLVQPAGSCRNPVIEGHAFCILHSCRAMLADATMCRGAVKDPHVSRLCDSGYHAETSREAYTRELIQRRKDINATIPQQREDEWRANLAFFEDNFGATCSQSPYYSRPNTITLPPPTYVDAPPQANPLPRAQSDLGARLSLYERMWGARHDDKWWVGEWRFHTSA